MERIVELLELNGEQAEALRCGGSKVAVSAGAGTGKTRFLIAVCLAELESGRADIDSIAAITFTENAAAELRERLAESSADYVKKFGARGFLTAETPGRISAAQISTIHGLAARIMRENLFSTNFPAGFEIADPADADAALSSAILETILKLREEKGAAAKTLGDLLTEESFNLDTALANITSIIRETEKKHLPRPLKTAEIDTGDEEAPAELDGDSIGMYGDIFKTNSASKRFKAIKKLRFPTSPDSDKCKTLMAIVENMEKVTEMKTAEKKEIEAAHELIARAENHIDTLNRRLTNLYLTVAEQSLDRHEEIKAENRAVRYEDLLVNALAILRENPSALKRYTDMFKLMLVDEFQDTDSMQNEIINLLSGEGKLVLVGDPFQSIYGFRGAKPELFNGILKSDKFEKFRLATNYRTSSQLLNFLNVFFRNLFSSKGYEPMTPGLEGGGVFSTLKVDGEKAEERRRSEAAVICKKISELVEDRGFAYSDIALIFRRKVNMDIYERALRLSGMPFRKDATGFFNLSETRDMVSMMKFIENPLDENSEAAVLRSPFFGISDAHLERYFTEKRRNKNRTYGDFLKSLRNGNAEWNRAADYLLSIVETVESGEEINFRSPAEAAMFAAYRLGYAAAALALPNGRNIRSNVIRFTEMCADLATGGKDLSEAVRYFDAARNTDEKQLSGGAETDSITLLTSHGAKGLEFPVVFVADSNYRQVNPAGRVAVDRNGKFFVCHASGRNARWKEAAKDNSDEEDRILYVTLTRAGKALFTGEYANPGSGSLASRIARARNFRGADSEAAKAAETGDEIPRSEPRKTPEKKPEKPRARATAETLRPLYEKETEEKDTNETGAEKFCDMAKTEEGEIVHRFFEIWDFSPDSVAEIADFVAEEKFFPASQVRDKVTKCAENALRSPLAEMAKNARGMKREYEFTVETADGIRNGKIDLLLETDKGTILVDYKYTDSFEKDRYTEQMDFYSAAVGKIYGRKPVERYICVLPGATLEAV